MPETRKLLTLSTSHLPQDLLKRLHRTPGVVADQTRHGALLYVPNMDTIREGEAIVRDAAELRKAHDDDPSQWIATVPPEVVRIWRFARRLGCDYVLFDQDGPVEKGRAGLPTWDW